MFDTNIEIPNFVLVILFLSFIVGLQFVFLVYVYNSGLQNNAVGLSLATSVFGAFIFFLMVRFWELYHNKDIPTKLDKVQRDLDNLAKKIEALAGDKECVEKK